MNKGGIGEITCMLEESSGEEDAEVNEEGESDEEKTSMEPPEEEPEAATTQSNYNQDFPSGEDEVILDPRLTKTQYGLRGNIALPERYQ